MTCCARQSADSSMGPPSIEHDELASRAVSQSNTVGAATPGNRVQHPLCLDVLELYRQAETPNLELLAYAFTFGTKETEGTSANCSLYAVTTTSGPHAQSTSETDHALPNFPSEKSIEALSMPRSITRSQNLW
eukprot:CAMPEP_0194518992 /NCGR_PEP_ID=MMETSP0253-20130528/52506_1 /TAXON_ID=2966 /ORGANISM="Noctiluca scintillans" /LENGTH=132 /DNA_ID=CAMNT_0039363077 /DNA_START=43 /DNA_END=438 /DNA_ORIENTATION=-